MSYSESQLDTLRSASERVLRAFSALGRDDGFMDSHKASLECERAMVALSDEMYTQTGYADKGNSE